MKIIAHRGNDGVHKENTINGVLNSLNKDCTDGVEFDIRITKDNDFVLNHDPFYNGLFIKDTKTSKLKKSGLNTLTEVLEKINNQKILLIEIKEEDNNYKILNDKLYKILKKYNLNYYICSFNYELLTDFRQKYPDIKLGLIIGVKKNTDKFNHNFDFSLVNYKHINKIKDEETFIWTVNEEKTFNMVKANQGIITDYPEYIDSLI